MRVLVADDDSSHNARLKHALDAWGHTVQVVSNPTEAITQLGVFAPDVILTSFPLSAEDVRPAILVTADESVDRAAEAVDVFHGFWFVKKPVSIEILRLLLLRAAEYRDLKAENERFRTEIAQPSLPIRVGMSIDQAERVLLEATLSDLRNNKTHAAKALGISAKTLHMKLRQYREQDSVENEDPAPLSYTTKTRGSGSG